MYVLRFRDQPYNPIVGMGWDGSTINPTIFREGEMDS